MRNNRVQLSLYEPLGNKLYCKYLITLVYVGLEINMVSKQIQYPWKIGDTRQHFQGGGQKNIINDKFEFYFFSNTSFIYIYVYNVNALKKNFKYLLYINQFCYSGKTYGCVATSFLVYLLDTTYAVDERIFLME